MSAPATSAPAHDPNRVMLPIQYREAPILADTFNETDRTFDIVWTAGAEVPRYDWYSGQRFIEVLEVSDKAIRLDRLQSGRAPVLDTHSRWSLSNILGNVVKNSVKIAGGQGRASVRLSSRDEVASIVRDIRDGVIANVSPGYVTHSYREEMRDGIMYRIATDWEPTEISFVPVGADPDAGRRDQAGQANQVRTFPCLITRAPLASAAAVRMRMRQAQAGA